MLRGDQHPDRTTHSGHVNLKIRLRTGHVRGATLYIDYKQNLGRVGAGHHNTRLERHVFRVAPALDGVKAHHVKGPPSYEHIAQVPAYSACRRRNRLPKFSGASAD